MQIKVVKQDKSFNSSSNSMKTQLIWIKTQKLISNKLKINKSNSKKCNNYSKCRINRLMSNSNNFSRLSYRCSNSNKWCLNSKTNKNTSITWCRCSNSSRCKLNKWCNNLAAIKMASLRINNNNSRLHSTRRWTINKSRTDLLEVMNNNEVTTIQDIYLFVSLIQQNLHKIEFDFILNNNNLFN